MLTNLLRRGEGSVPARELQIVIGRQGPSPRTIYLPLEPFLTAEEYQQSADRPFSLSNIIEGLRGFQPQLERSKANWLWLYRDALYVTQREPHTDELDEVNLRIKALHYQRDEELKRLREQVANCEAIDAHAAVAQRPERRFLMTSHCWSGRGIRVESHAAHAHRVELPGR